MYRRILVPTDGTELCSLALDTALRLAQFGGGVIVGLHAYSVDDAAAPPAGTVDPSLPRIAQLVAKRSGVFVADIAH